MRNPMTGVVTSGYDLHRRHPTLGTVQPHRGLDIAHRPRPDRGTIRAAYAGRVVAVEKAWRSGWSAIWGRSGNGILIRNPDGEHQWYGHLAEVHVNVGQLVKEGQVIGVEGATGNVSGPHLHFEVHNKSSGPANNWTHTRDPMIDFRAAGITPGTPPTITPASTQTGDWSDMATKDEIKAAFREVLAEHRPGIDLTRTTAWRVKDGKQEATTASRVLQEVHGLAYEAARASGATEAALREVLDRPRENENKEN